MSLTPEHTQARTLSPAQLEEICTTKTFEQILALPTFERAEVIEYLVENGAQVRIKANDKADVAFTISFPEMRMDKEEDVPLTRAFAIPGGDKEPGVFPVRVAVHVATNRDQPQFGGATFSGGEIKSDGGVTPVKRVPANPKLLSFELVHSARLVLAA